MNILFTSSAPFHPLRGGVGRVTDTLCRALQKRGHKVWYLHHTWYAEDRKDFAYPAPTAVLPYENEDGDKNHQFYIKFLKEHAIDVVICQDALFDLTFQQIDNLPIKVISVIHNNPLLDYNMLWHKLISLRNDSFIEQLKRIVRCCLYYRIKRQMWKHAVCHFGELNKLSNKILLLSPHYLPFIQRMNEQYLTKTGFIYNPNTYPLQFELPTQKQNEIIFVGRCSKIKRIDRLLKVWNLLWKEFPTWHLTIIGDGGEKENLVKLTDKYRLGHVSFTGFQDPLPYYKRASIVCMTSDFEGFPMTLVEAMQFGCVPIAFSSFESIYDTIIPGVTGEIVKPFDLKELRIKLSKLICDNEYRERLSKASFEHVKQFDVNQIVEQWETLLKTL